MSAAGAIAGLGGGGLRTDDLRGVQERFLLSPMPVERRRERPRVRLRGLAHGDREPGQAKALRTFSKLRCDIDVPPCEPAVAGARSARSPRDRLVLAMKRAAS